MSTSIYQYTFRTSVTRPSTPTRRARGRSSSPWTGQPDRTVSGDPLDMVDSRMARNLNSPADRFGVDIGLDRNRSGIETVTSPSPLERDFDLESVRGNVRDLMQKVATTEAER